MPTTRTRDAHGRFTSAPAPGPMSRDEAIEAVGIPGRIEFRSHGNGFRQVHHVERMTNGTVGLRREGDSVAQRALDFRNDEVWFPLPPLTESAAMPTTSETRLTRNAMLDSATDGTLVEWRSLRILSSRPRVYRVDTDHYGRRTLQFLYRGGSWDTTFTGDSAPEHAGYVGNDVDTSWTVTNEVVELSRITRTYVRSCQACGEEIDTANDEYDFCDDCDHYTCDNCGPCDNDGYGHRDYQDGDSYGVHSWNYRPNYMPKGDVSTGAMFGIELEVGGQRRTISNVVRSVDADEDHLYMKDDGSISGVEIVTHPATLDYVHAFPFVPLLDSLRDAGSMIDDGYGLHIHVDRDAFLTARGKRSVSHQMSWLMFLYRNTSSLELLARRRESRWASFRKPDNGVLKRKAQIAGYSDDRYLAVNTNNTPTYELRFFKSTLDPQEFLAAVEFADASVEYTRTTKTPDILNGSGLTWSHFTQYVQDRNDRYSNLVPVLADMRDNPRDRFARHETDGGY